MWQRVKPYSLSTTHSDLWRVIAGERMRKGGGGGEGRRGDDLPLLQLGQQLLPTFVQVVQAVLRTAVRRPLRDTRRETLLTSCSTVLPGTLPALQDSSLRGKLLSTHPDVRPHGRRLGARWIVAFGGVSVPSAGLLVVEGVCLSCRRLRHVEGRGAHSDQVPLGCVRLWRRGPGVGPVRTSVVVREVGVGEGWGSVGGLVGTLRVAIRRVGVLVRSGLAGRGRITHVVPGKRLLVGIPCGAGTRDMTLLVHLHETVRAHSKIQPYLLRTAGARTGRQRAGCGCRSTFLESVAGGTLENLW